MSAFYDFSLPRLDGTIQRFADFSGKVVLVVNVASKCGLTPQYEGLEQLWRSYKNRGLVVLGFPCNQFADQEPGSEADIAQFCSVNYDVSFPMFAKIEVNGPGAHPLYGWLKAVHPADIEWNFAKFLVGRDGAVVGRFAPIAPPADLAAPIERLL